MIQALTSLAEVRASFGDVTLDTETGEWRCVVDPIHNMVMCSTNLEQLQQALDLLAAWIAQKGHYE